MGARPLAVMGRIEAGGPWQSHSVRPQTCVATLKGLRSGMCSPSAVGSLRIGGDSEWRCVEARPLAVMDSASKQVGHGSRTVCSRRPVQPH